MYSYWLSFNNVDFSEIYPSEKVSVRLARYENQRFYRKELESGFKINRKLNATVYDQLELWFGDKTKFATSIYLEIYRAATRTGTAYYKGTASINDGILNKDGKWYRFEALTNDGYKQFIDLEEVPYTIEIDGEFGGLTDKYYTFTDITLGGFTNVNYDTFSGSAGVIGTAIKTQTASPASVYFSRSFTTTADRLKLDFTGFTDNSGGLPGSAVYPYLELRDTGGVSRSNSLHVTATGEYNLAPTVTGTLRVTLFNVTATQADWSATFTADYLTGYNSAGGLYQDFMKDFVQTSTYMGLNVSVVSTFLWNDSLPSSGVPSTVNTFITSNSSGNYVTQATASNYLNNLFIGSKIQLGAETSQDSDFQMTFKDVYHDLRFLNAWWFIDDDSKLRIEHEKWFVTNINDNTALDLTSSIYDKYKPDTDRQVYKYDKKYIYGTESFECAEAETDGFTATNIEYNKVKTSTEARKSQFSRITTDIEYIEANTADVEPEGYFLASCDLFATAQYVIRKGLVNIALDDRLNHELAWLNLIPDLYGWGRSALNATIEAYATTFASVTRFLQQDGVRFGYQSDIDPYAPVKTTFGDAEILTAKRDLDSDFVELTLIYDMYA